MDRTGCFSIIGEIEIRIRYLLEALLLIQMARLLDCFVSRIWLRDYYQRKREELKSTNYEKLIEEAPKSAVQSVFYIIAAILILYNLNVNQTIYDFGTDVAPEPLKLTNILYAPFYFDICSLDQLDFHSGDFIWLFQTEKGQFWLTICY